MKFDAWPVEPPGFGSGPLSIRTRSFQPRWARWPIRLLPTKPAPTTTTFACAGRELAACESMRLIYHKDALVARDHQLVLRDRGRRRRDDAGGPVRGVRRAGSAGRGDVPSLRRGRRERAHRGDDH